MFIHTTTATTTNTTIISSSCNMCMIDGHKEFKQILHPHLNALAGTAPNQPNTAARTCMQWPAADIFMGYALSGV